jgi:hypothetical protein
LKRYHRRIAAYKGPFQKRSLTKEAKITLELWLQLLDKAKRGISLNLLSYQQPTCIVISDACPTGMGGYSIKSGKGWRIQFPFELTNKNNTAEFLAAVVSILWAHHQGDIDDEGIVLALTNNTSAAAWMQRCNKDEKDDPTTAEIARKLAITCIENNFTIHSQHIPG